MKEEKDQDAPMARVKKILNLLLDMILGLKDIVKEHEDRLNGMSEAGKEMAKAGLGTVEVIRGVIQDQENQYEDIEDLMRSSGFMMSRQETQDARIKALENEVRDLRALVLKQLSIDLDQGGLYFKAWYEERDSLRAKVKAQAGIDATV